MLPCHKSPQPPIRITAVVPLLLALVLPQAAARALPRELALTLAEAELEALRSSSLLESYTSNMEAAREQASAQFALLLPRLALDASYRYITNVPDIKFPQPAVPPFQLGAHSNYSIGPTLTYMLWDTGSRRKAYYSLLKLADSREEDRKTARRQLLLNVRTAYIQVQRALEELRLVNDSLKLARTQSRDISVNFRAGAASRLDLLDSQRAALNYELQFKQSEAALRSAIEDLLALTHQSAGDLARVGPEGVENLTLVIRLDRLDRSVAQASTSFAPPNEAQPQLRSQELLAESSELAAQSQRAQLLPTLEVSARASYDYPNGIIPETVQQNSFTVGLSMPLFETNRTKHLAEQRLKEAEATRLRKDQLRTDLERDYSKGQSLLKSLREQRELAARDVAQSEESARLFYSSYREGRSTLTDVLSANLRALQSKVSAARIDANLLSQVALLQAISGEEEADHGSGD